MGGEDHGFDGRSGEDIFPTQNSFYKISKGGYFFDTEKVREKNVNSETNYGGNGSQKE